MYGLKSPSWGFSSVTYTVDESNRDGSTLLTQRFGGTPGKRPVRSSHVAPSYFVTQTLPSSVPAYRIPGRTGDSLIETIVLCVSAPVASLVMPPVRSRAGVPSGLRPVLMRMRFASCVDRSGEIGRRLSPISTDLKTRLPAA